MRKSRRASDGKLAKNFNREFKKTDLGVLLGEWIFLRRLKIRKNGWETRKNDFCPQNLNKYVRKIFYFLFCNRREQFTSERRSMFDSQFSKKKSILSQDFFKKTPTTVQLQTNSRHFADICEFILKLVLERSHNNQRLLMKEIYLQWLKYLKR